VNQTTCLPGNRTKQDYPDNYPLAKLKFQPAETELSETLSKMSYKELKEVTQTIIHR